MALMLAPYNSAMRLGMGFNSYTQALCVNDVVRKPGNVPATEADLRAAQLTQKTDDATVKPKQITAGTQQRAPQGVLDGASGSISRKFVDGQKEVSQVVSWEASFIENSSDVLKKLDVSGALSIKMAGLGQLSGKAAFVDSTDIKQADIKYLVHVKVTNQRLIADNITEFAPIDNIEPGQFTEIYGDCFISGFIEGGEFDALVTITTEETIKKNSLSGGLELSANFSGLDVSGNAAGGKDDNSTLKNAQTKISVTWSGGGDIRDDKITEWTLQNLKEISMSFPDAVAACKHGTLFTLMLNLLTISLKARSVAILTKYTSLRSYHEQAKKGSALDYENAGIYTAALYDAYTDYKIMWNQIHTMISGLNANKIELFIQNASDGLTKYAAIVKQEQADKESHYKELLEVRKAEQDAQALVPFTGNRSQALKPIEKSLPNNKVEVYDRDVFGLERAARDCRFEMIKLVREVDAVTRDPKAACDPDRISQYLSPSVFRLLIPTRFKEPLPTHEEWTATNDDLKQQTKDVKTRESEINELKKKLEAALITPRRDESGTLLANTPKDNAELHPKVQTSLSELSHRADDYRMQSLLENKNSISTGATFFNDLQPLELGARPTELRLWRDDKKIKGICVVYTTGKEIAHGTREGNPQHVLQLANDEVITEFEVHAVKGAEDKLSVTAIALATSKCNILSAGTKSNGKTHSFSMTDYRQWSFRGFFGFTFDDGFEDLGIVWGKDIATAETRTVQMPPARNLLGMGLSLQQKTKAAMSESKPTEHFYMGDCISTGSPSSSATSFSALDTIDGSSKIRKIAFSVSTGRLSGLKVEYSDNTQVTHGAYSEASEPWNCDVKAPIVAAKLTVGKTLSTPAPFVDSVELVCGDANGELPLWPLDVSTIRYLGDHRPEDQLEVVSKLTEQAPKLGRANWTLRGFYGEESQGLITRLGLIWGCA
ncbi:Fc.00g080390.m01.CDS01 [Cosmosporella sp. VM-42]